MEERIEERIARMEGILDQVDKRLGKVEAELKELRQETGAELRSLREEMRAEIGKLEDQIGSLREEMRAEVRKLEGQINGLREEMRAEISGLRGEMRAEVGRLETEINGLRGEIGELRKEMISGFQRMDGRLFSFMKWIIAALIGMWATIMAAILALLLKG